MNQRVKFQINESAQTELQKIIVSKFGSRFLNQDNKYEASIEDLKIIYDCINEFIFGNKLPKIEIVVADMKPNDIGKAVFMFNLNDHGVTPKIKYLREPDRDTPLFASSALCHEMIHYYDFIYGPLSQLKGKTISAKDGKQFIGEYDAHGDFFMRWMNKIISNGIPTSITHPDKVKVRYYMNNKELKENEKPLTLEERAKMFYDSVKTDDLFLVEVKDGEVYCVMQ